MSKVKGFRQAIRLLSQSATINQVANQVGYANVSKFCESFKKATGKTPKTFKANLIK